MFHFTAQLLRLNRFTAVQTFLTKQTLAGERICNFYDSIQSLSWPMSNTKIRSRIRSTDKQTLNFNQYICKLLLNVSWCQIWLAKYSNVSSHLEFMENKLIWTLWKQNQTERNMTRGPRWQGDILGTKRGIVLGSFLHLIHLSLLVVEEETRCSYK